MYIWGLSQSLDPKTYHHASNMFPNPIPKYFQVTNHTYIYDIYIYIYI